jgi:hypothetical protein
MASISGDIREDKQRNYDCLQGADFHIAAFQAVSVRLSHTAHTLSVSHEWPRWLLLASRHRVATVAGALTMLVTAPTNQVPINIASKKSMSLSYAARRAGGASRPPQK